MKKIKLLIIPLLILTSCSSDDEDNSSDLNIRLSNISAFDFTNIQINTASGNVDFEDIPSGQKTKYKAFDVAYRYAYIKVEINRETYSYQPIDYVGERPLESGNYTYQLDVNDAEEHNRRLSLTLIEE